MLLGAGGSLALLAALPLAGSSNRQVAKGAWSHSAIMGAAALSLWAVIA